LQDDSHWANYAREAFLRLLFTSNDCATTKDTHLCPVLKICFGPPTAESKNLKNHVNFDVGDLFFRSPALWSSQNVFGPPTAGRVVVDIKDRASMFCTPTFGSGPIRLNNKILNLSYATDILSHISVF